MSSDDGRRIFPTDVRLRQGLFDCLSQSNRDRIGHEPCCAALCVTIHNDATRRRAGFAPLAAGTANSATLGAADSSLAAAPKMWRIMARTSSLWPSSADWSGKRVVAMTWPP